MTYQIYGDAHVQKMQLHQSVLLSSNVCVGNVMNTTAYVQQCMVLLYSGAFIRNTFSAQNHK